MLHQPGAAVAQPELALELQRRDVVLGLGEQLHGEEPARQRQLARFEDGAADQARLELAAAALPVAQAAALEAGARCAATGRADESMGPARRLQRCTALLLGSIEFQKFGHRKTRLKLHSVHRHGTPPRWVRPFSGLSVSQREAAEIAR